MKKILITGASGFIGRQCLAPLLARDFEVHAVALQPIAEFERTVAWHCQDLLNEEDMQRLLKSLRASHCLHLAWYTEPGKYWSSLENLKWASASAALIHSFQQHGGERFVGAGSCAEYDWRYGHCSEEITPLAPATLYGSAKNGVHQVLSMLSRQTGMSSAWGRVFFLYGPHEHPVRLVPSVITSLMRGEPALCSHGDQIRDFLHVEDAAGAFVSLLESDVTGPVNIASGVPTSIRDLVLEIADLLNGRGLVRFGAIPSAADEPVILSADVRRLKNAVGYQPKYTRATGVEQTVAWWKAKREIEARSE